MLLVGKCRGFARGTHRHKAVRAACDLLFNKVLKGAFIDGTIAEWGNEGRN